MSRTLQKESPPGEARRLSANALFLMTEYVETQRPLLAALAAGELLAIERQAGEHSELAGVLAKLRHRWWRLAQRGDPA